tara:strand:+ start:505 stop:966 length:462 start_codon:yes stop_codon:yes gene_type:complete
MSVKAMTYVWENSPYNGNALIVHLALADHADDQGICWPSQQYLANKCKISVRQIRRIIHQMIADSYLFIEQQSRAGVSNNRYRLLFKKPQVTDVLSNFEDDREWPVGEVTAVASGRGQADGHPNHHITINNHQRKGPPEEVKELLDRLRKKHG